MSAQPQAIFPLALVQGKRRTAFLGLQTKRDEERHRPWTENPRTVLHIQCDVKKPSHESTSQEATKATKAVGGLMGETGTFAPHLIAETV